MMKQHAKYLSLVFLSTSLVTVASSTVSPKFTIRSQGTNALRRLVGNVDKVDVYDMDAKYWNLSAMLEYTRSFDSEEIAECLFGCFLCDNRILKIEGSRACNRDSNALLADYFYLPTDFKSQVTIEPRIQNFLVDFNYYLGLDSIRHGLYFWIQAPLTWTKWSLRTEERVIDAGTNAHDEGYFTVNSLARNELLNNFTEYSVGQAPGIDNIVTQFALKGDDRQNNQQFDTNFQGLQCAKFCADETDTRLSEVRFALGWNFLLDEDYHLGLNLQVSAPTGNKVKPDYLFAPQNGNDRHWELGAGIGAHYIFWRSEDEDKHFGFYLDANLTHMFKNHQTRCFDLCGKPLSRYMLAERLTTTVQDNLKGNDVAADAQFAAVFAPVANLTTFDVEVSVGINADIVAMFNYTAGAWSWDFGYNFWGRSCEKISLDCNQCSPFQENTWALKGDAYVYGYMNADGNNLFTGDPVALSATMNEATITGGKNFGDAGVTAAQIAAGKANPNIDNPQLATGDTSDTQLNVSRTVATQTNTSIQPVFIAQSDVNFVRTKGISNKLFYHMGYTWLEKENWVPYVGVGGEVEWASTGGKDCKECESDCGTKKSNNPNKKCNTSCSTGGTCLKCGLSQWGVWFKFGATFQ